MRTSGERRFLWRLSGETRGTLAVKFALILPVMLGIAGGCIDYGMLMRERSRLQTAADAAATAAALELTLIDTSKHDVTALARGIVLSMVRANTGNPISSAASTANATGTGTGDIVVTAVAQTAPLMVTVDAVQTFRGPFGLLSSAVPQFSVRAVAKVVGKPNICVLGLDPAAGGTIELWTMARMTAQNCAVYSNSTSTWGISVKNNAAMSASMICSGGGAWGGKGSFTPQPVTDCPFFDDPLANRPGPTVGGCTATNTSLLNQGVTLQPGVYCGGITIKGASDVKFAPGVYVVKNGPFWVSDNAIVSGDGVGFYFSGQDARFQFDGNTTIGFSAPEAGEMAGLLFQEDRSQQVSYTHQILSDNARMLLGTIYLPRGELKIDANKPIADKSAYTAIVARSLRLYSGPHLVLNTNYDKTAVPVPEGIKGVGQPVVLAQ